MMEQGQHHLHTISANPTDNPFISFQCGIIDLTDYKTTEFSGIFNLTITSSFPMHIYKKKNRYTYDDNLNLV